MEYGAKTFLKKLLKQIWEVIKIEIDSEEVCKESFARVCVKVDIAKPLNGTKI